MNTPQRATGSFYTEVSPFRLEPFIEWFFSVTSKDSNILEPFAGCNQIPLHLKEIGFKGTFTCYDKDPSKSLVNSLKIGYRDTVKNFPKGFDVCITNPPYLSKSSASNNNIKYIGDRFDDVYKKCLKLMLDNCKYVAAILPATFATSPQFRERLHTIIFVSDKLFRDTDIDVCIALFNPEKTNNVKYYQDNNLITQIGSIEVSVQPGELNVTIKFNRNDGELGLYAVDKKNKKIRFCKGKDMPPIKSTDRTITRISVTSNIYKIDSDELIEKCNHILDKQRIASNDVSLSSYRNTDRKRLTFGYARNIIYVACMLIGSKL